VQGIITKNILYATIFIMNLLTVQDGPATFVSVWHFENFCLSIDKFGEDIYYLEIV